MADKLIIFTVLLIVGGYASPTPHPPSPQPGPDPSLSVSAVLNGVTYINKVTIHLIYPILKSIDGYIIYFDLFRELLDLG